MPRLHRLPRLRSTGLALAVAASALVLAGCAAPASPTDEPSASATDPAGEPGASEAPAEPPVPFEIACDELLSADDVYAFNPNFGAAPGYEPAADGALGIDEEAGTACGLLNQTSGALIEFGVATPPEGALEQRKNDAALASKPVPTYGTPPEVEGYFTVAGEHGEAQVFSGPYWIVVDSVDFVEPGDAQVLVSSILENLAG
ncbi:iron ABC transporter ATP-binding protein [Agromyces lapidis]|uniref:Iron ABC transporter ATP-binding protein n=1 Tax=Agromyces lapidis TaxID=279574 RepID=A0ABV5SRF3_9MICO|nr:iron ABC transporter ATP-binding protein [Agromyces lapidis]